jgi:hypothetical protein
MLSILPVDLYAMAWKPQKQAMDDIIIPKLTPADFLEADSGNVFPSCVSLAASDGEELFADEEFGWREADITPSLQVGTAAGPTSSLLLTYASQSTRVECDSTGSRGHFLTHLTSDKSPSRPPAPKSS